MKLEQVLADLREDANVLRRTGHSREAETYDRILESLSATTELEEVLTWLSEEDAMLRSGRGKAWIRSRYPEWERRGHAKMEGRRRRYRMVVVPQRINLEEAYRAGADRAQAA